MALEAKAQSCKEAVVATFPISSHHAETGTLFGFPQFSCCTKMWREYISPNSSLLGLTICMGNSHTKQFGSIPPKGQLPVKEESPEKTTTRWQSLPGQLKEKTEIPPDEGKTDTGENENRKRPGGFGC